MKTLIGGAVVATLGLILLIMWQHSFFNLLKGTIPALLLIGGGLALYLGFDELQDSWKQGVRPEPAGGDDKDKEIEELKKEIETLKDSE